MFRIIKFILNKMPSLIKKIISRRLTDNFFDKYALNIWEKQFIKVAENIDLIDDKLAREISQDRSIKRIYYSMFYFSEGSLKFDKLVLTISLIALNSTEKIDEKNLIQYAHAVREYWIEELLENDILGERFKNKNDVTIYDLKKEYEDERLLKIISNPENLRKAFFESYSNERTTNTIIRVYLPDENGVVKRNNFNSYVDVSVNIFLGIPLGFFRIGYDYSLPNYNVSVSKVSYSKNNMKEAAKFGNYNFGKFDNSSIIWAR